MMAFGLNPVITRQKTIKMLAMELREAKKPLVVEKRPISASANTGKLMSGERNTFSELDCQDKSGAMPVDMLLRKMPMRKSLANNNSRIVCGLLNMLILKAVKPAMSRRATNTMRIFGSFLKIILRLGCKITNKIQKMAK